MALMNPSCIPVSLLDLACPRGGWLAWDPEISEPGTGIEMKELLPPFISRAQSSTSSGFAAGHGSVSREQHPALIQFGASSSVTCLHRFS